MTQSSSDLPSNTSSAGKSRRSAAQQSERSGGLDIAGESQKLAGVGRRMASTWLDGRKESLTQTFTSTAEGLRRLGDSYSDQPNIKSYIEAAADGLDTVSEELNSQRIEDLARQAEELLAQLSRHGFRRSARGGPRGQPHPAQRRRGRVRRQWWRRWRRRQPAPQHRPRRPLARPARRGQSMNEQPRQPHLPGLIGEVIGEAVTLMQREFALFEAETKQNVAGAVNGLVAVIAAAALLNVALILLRSLGGRCASAGRSAATSRPSWSAAASW